MSAASASSAAGSVVRSTSTWMNDSRLLRRRIVGRERRQRAVGGALDAEDRMDDQVQRQAVAIDLHRHRIDEKRHVIVDDLDDRVLRLPAVLLDRRVEHAHARASRVALACEIPVRKRRPVEVGRRSLFQILRVDLCVVAGDESLQRRPQLRRNPRGDEPCDFILPLRADVFGGVVHRWASFGCERWFVVSPYTEPCCRARVPRRYA